MVYAITEKADLDGSLIVVLGIVIMQSDNWHARYAYSGII